MQAEAGASDTKAAFPSRVSRRASLQRQKTGVDDTVHLLPDDGVFASSSDPGALMGLDSMQMQLSSVDLVGTAELGVANVLGGETATNAVYTLEKSRLKRMVVASCGKLGVMFLSILAPKPGLCSCDFPHCQKRVPHEAEMSCPHI